MTTTSIQIPISPPSKPKKAFTIAFEKKKVAFWGGGQSKGGGWKENDSNPEMIITAVSAGNEFKIGRGLGPDWLISLNWPDYQAPHWTVEEWDELIEFIVNNEINNVHCQCMAGHGRTGTMLSILFQRSTALHKTVVDLVKDIRDRYDHEAVESKAQLNYIAKICGIPLGEGASKLVKEAVMVYPSYLNKQNPAFTDFDDKYTKKIDLETATKIFEAWICSEKAEVFGKGADITFLGVDAILVRPDALAEIKDGKCASVSWKDIDTTFYPKSNKKVVETADDDLPPVWKDDWNSEWGGGWNYGGSSGTK